MSYILDALRKSEMERQMASGSSASLFYPIPVEHGGRGWREPSMFVAGAGLAILVVMLTWWLWGQSRGEDVAKPIAKTSAAVAVAEPAVAVAPAVHAVHAEPTPIPEAAEPVASALPMAKPVPQPLAKKKDMATNVAKAAVTADTKPSLTSPGTAEKSEVPADTLQKDFPTLSIAGYIRDDQGNSLAMINEKLVREGEEVEPGLRLEKILGENSIFSYKGRRFRR